MTLLTIPALEALNRIKVDAHRAMWPTYRSPSDRYEGILRLLPSNTFEFNYDDKVFTIGSCFARNIESRLHEIGFETPMYNPSIAETFGGFAEGLAFTNKFSVSAIRTELEWACGLPRPPEEFILLPFPGGGVVDPFVNRIKGSGVPINDARERRAFVEGLFRRVVDCRVVVMTLGLVEVWRDKRSGLRLNVAPVKAILADPDRFVLEVMSYDDVLSELEGIHALLTEYGHPDFKLLVTVSPVPLLATFRPEDVLSANSYSKAVQRAAVEAFVLNYTNVDYFPSFETVTLTDRRLAFTEDNRHVQPGVVARIVDQFVETYVRDIQFIPTEAPLRKSKVEPVSARELVSAAKWQARERDYTTAAQYFARCISKYGDRHSFISVAELRIHYGTTLIRSGRVDEGLRQSELAARSEGATPAIVIKSVNQHVSRDRRETARRILDAAIAANGASVELKLRHAELEPDGVDKEPNISKATP